MADTLFEYADPIGQTVYLNGDPFLVVGTYYQKDGGEEDSMDNMLVVPSSMTRSLLTSDYITSYTVKVDTSDQVDTVITDDGLDPDSVAKTRDLVKELVLAHQSEPTEESE